MALASNVLGKAIAIGVVLLGAWALIRGVEADPSVVGSLATAFAAVLVVVLQRNREKTQELEQSHREKMIPIYEEVLIAIRDSADRDEAENEDLFKQLQTRLLLYGPAPVIREWLIWRKLGEEMDEPGLALVLGWERVLRAIRADLGHDDSVLQEGDLLRVFINDLDVALVEAGETSSDMSSKSTIS